MALHVYLHCFDCGSSWVLHSSQLFGIKRINSQILSRLGRLLVAFKPDPFSSAQLLCTLDLSVFSPRGGGGQDYPRELENFDNLESNSLPMNYKCVSKMP